MVLGLALAAAVATGFVRVEGADFALDGQSFRFVGANLRVMHGQVYRERYQEVLDAAARDGLRVGRIWALGEGEPDAEPWRRAEDLFRAGPDGWIEDAYRQLDRVLVAARQRNLRMIVTLANHWKDYGGAPQYLRWIGLDQLDSLFGLRDRFYSDPRVRRYYQAHIERLLARKNSIDGTPYAEEPAILAWELMNESQVEAPDGARARREWIAWAAGLIKAHDRNHLVAPGLLGYSLPEERADWIESHKLPGVDYCDAHIYPKESLRIRSPADLDRLIDDQAQLARYVIRKPLVIGEFAVPLGEARWRGSDVAGWYRRLLARARLDAVAGVLVWIYEPHVGAGSGEYSIYTDTMRSAAIRTLLAQAARALARVGGAGTAGPKNPLLGPAHDAHPLIDFHVEVPGEAAPPVEWASKDGALELAIPAEAFTRGRWEHVGTWGLGEVVHAYGARTGFFDYRFRRPPQAVGAPARLQIHARLSSEYPGTLSPPDGSSRVFVLIDGREVATLEAFPDDGRGRWYTITVDDPGVLAALGGAATHTLRFEVRAGPDAHGVCVYGRAGQLGGVPDAAPLELRWITSRE
ncbi:MAG TPA: hypothetical protein VKN99_25690 [Polyangia bacterium]|nr:hypothetical protein [Polyangia bacterium]